MANLHEVVGALINQIERGRAQADLGTLEIANIYRDIPLLSDFPIPKISLDQITVDLKVSVGSVPVPENYLSQAARTQAVERVGAMVLALQDQDPSLREMLHSDPELKKAWVESREEILQKVAECVPEEGAVNADLVARNVGTVLRGKITSLVTTPGLKIQKLRLHTFVTERAPEVEKRVTGQVRDTIAAVVREQPVSLRNMDVLVTTSELQSVPSDRITTLHLTFSESDRVWTQFETEKGEIIKKIVPR
jgi:hypothetical protein